MLIEFILFFMMWVFLTGQGWFWSYIAFFTEDGGGMQTFTISFLLFGLASAAILSNMFAEQFWQGDRV